MGQAHLDLAGQVPRPNVDDAESAPRVERSPCGLVTVDERSNLRERIEPAAQPARRRRRSAQDDQRLAQAMHQPSGLIVPVTIVHPFGALKKRQPAHFFPPGPGLS